MRKHLVYCSMFLLLSSCVSIELPGSKPAPAKDVEFAAPAAPFSRLKNAKIDQAWISSESGNTISYFSDCKSDPSLDSLTTQTLSALGDLKVISEKETSFNGREAKESLAEGRVDGVPVKLSILVFKKNSCNYTLTYGGTLANFPQETNTFEMFKSQFKAP